MHVLLGLLGTSSGGTSSAPLWAGTFGTVSQIITAVGIITGGAFAYFKLVKGRAFRPRAEITAEPRIVDIHGNRGLHVPIKIQNSGQVSLLFSPHAKQQVYLSQIKADAWDNACKNMELIAWEEHATKDPIGIAIPEGKALDQKYNPGKSVSSPPSGEGGDEEASEGLAEKLAKKWGLNELDGCEKVAPGESWVREILVPIDHDTVACLIRISTHPCTHVAQWRAPFHRRRCCPSGKEEDGNEQQSSEKLSGDEKSNGDEKPNGDEAPAPNGLSFWKDIFVMIEKQGA